MKKRGISLPPQVLVLLIMVIIAGILIFIFAVKAPRALCDGNVQTCKTSLLIATRGEKFFFDLRENCPASDIKRFERESPEEVNEIIAKELEKCAWKFEGIEFTTGAIQKIFTRPLLEGQMRCFKCAEFNFDSYTKKEAYKEAYDKGQTLGTYTQQNEIHCSKPKVTFKEYFNKINQQREEGTGAMRVIYPGALYGPAAVIDPEKNYLIVAMVDIEAAIKRGRIAPINIYMTPVDNKDLAACDFLI